MDKTVRCFLAIDLNEDVYQALEDLSQKLRSPRIDVRWVRTKNIHLTLRFFGEISSQEITSASQAIEKAVETVSPFEIKIQGLGAFPSLRSPRIVWAGIDASHQLIDLEQRISSELKQKEWPPPDKPFKPHLTLGRVKSSRNKQDFVHLVIKHGQASIGRLDVDHVSLIRRDLRPSGAVYTPINRFSFKGRKEYDKSS